MPAAKIAISLDENILREIDGLVRKKVFPNRSRAIQEAVKDKINRMSKSRLASECAKLNAEEEIRLAEEGMNAEAVEWPEY
jgi:metal-responsive CopG/Arc/MetJ family transcriptional regulator